MGLIFEFDVAIQRNLLEDSQTVERGKPSELSEVARLENLFLSGAAFLFLAEPEQGATHGYYPLDSVCRVV